MKVFSTNYFKATLLFVFIAPSAVFAQNIQQQQMIYDSTSFVIYTKGDTSFTNYASPSLDVRYRKTGSKSTVNFQKPNSFNATLLDATNVLGRLSLDTNYTQLSAADSSTDPVWIKLKKGKAEINAKEIWFNGDWLKVPVKSTYPVISDPVPPEGSLFYNKQTQSLMTSNGVSSHPSYWEFPDSSEINPFILETNWTKNIGYNNLPLLRVRHPLNVTGINLGSESRSRDFTIMPYQYGMAIDYNGVVECWVGEWSIHRGHSYSTNIEGNGNAGWGGVLWVGDDEDLGGVRATSRNGTDAYYSEISSERFNGSSHGNFRVRVVDESDKVSIVHGGRGSKNITLDIGRIVDTTVLSAGLTNGLSLQTNGYNRVMISKDGKVGINNSQPTSLLDLVSPNGFDQLRLQTKYTPANTADPNGKVGDVSWDNEYIYIKTEQGWKRTGLQSF